MATAAGTSGISTAVLSGGGGHVVDVAKLCCLEHNALDNVSIADRQYFECVRISDASQSEGSA